MCPQSLTHTAERVIAELAARQHGVVARSQLLDEGVSRDQIRLRLRNGRLHQLHRGVYLVGHGVPARYAPEMAALLVCGEQAVLSHHSAAALWNLIPYPAPGRVRVTVPPERSAARPGIEIHRSHLDPRDIRRRDRMALTSPPRTILDLAGDFAATHALDVGGPYELERLVAEAQYRRLASETELRDQLVRNPHKPGVVALRHVLDLPAGPRRTRSPGERAMLRLLRRAGLTGFETNARLHGYEVDLLWRDRALVVELDGYDGHSGRVAFERDRLKVATLSAHGVRVIPVTGRQLRRDPDGVLERLLRALDARADLGK